MIESWAPADYLASLRRIRYTANVCLIELRHSLSDTYWLNVNDPTFPYVGIIEHTNFQRPQNYGGRHIVYLSKYLPHTHQLYSMSADELLDFSIPFLNTMFPAFQRDWIEAHHLWRARWSQPVVNEIIAASFHLLRPPWRGFTSAPWHKSTPRIAAPIMPFGKDVASELRCRRRLESHGTLEKVRTETSHPAAHLNL